MTPPHIDELIRLLVDSEKRNAELAAMIMEIGGEQGMEMLERHSRSCGMSEWHKKFLGSTAQPTTP